MLSPQLLALLRLWWSEGKRRGVMLPHGWLFPGRNSPIRSRPARSTARSMRQPKPPGSGSVSAPYVAPQLRHPSAGTGCRYPRHPGPAGAQQARYDRALCPRCDQDDPLGDQSSRAFGVADGRRGSRRLNAACAPRSRSPISSELKGRLSCRSGRPPEPDPAQGHVGDRELPHGGTRRPRRCLRGLRAPAHRLQQLPQPALPQVPGRRCAHLAGRARGRPAAGRLLPCRLHAAHRGRRHRLAEQGDRLRSAVPRGVGDDDDDRG